MMARLAPSVPILDNPPLRSYPASTIISPCISVEAYRSHGGCIRNCRPPPIIDFLNCEIRVKRDERDTFAPPCFPATFQPRRPRKQPGDRPQSEEGCVLKSLIKPAFWLNYAYYGDIIKRLPKLDVGSSNLLARFKPQNEVTMGLWTR